MQLQCAHYKLNNVVLEYFKFVSYCLITFRGHEMGCLQSKNESSDIHPNVFRVINIDENGSDLCSGQLEITDSTIVLYREGRETTVWPLHSLRRYGFESEIFSFESGNLR